MTVGVLMAFYAYLEMIYNPLNRLSELNMQLANSRAAIDRLIRAIADCLRPAVRRAAAAPGYCPGVSEGCANSDPG
jgi:ABC-type multidrug transport system fused ATPase/permease subunit